MAINRKSITFIGLAGVLAAGLGVLVAVTRPQEILTSTVTMQKTERVIAVVGRARPVDRIDVRPLYAGQVVRLLHDEGDTVAAGEPLAVIKADVEQAQTQSELARAQSARARAAEALQSYQRTKTLFDRGFAAEAALDQASAALRAAQADVAAAEATAKVAAARTREFVVRAPNASLVLARPIDAGQVVDTNTTLFELGSLTGGEIEAEVDEAYADAIQPGMAARFAATGSKATFGGQVSEVSPRVDAATGGRLVRLTYGEMPGLVPGRSVDVTIVVRPAEKVILVPRSAVLDASVAPKVYVLGKDGVVGVRTVRIADWPSGDAIVESGLAEGDRVLLEPAMASPGERVRGRAER